MILVADSQYENRFNKPVSGDDGVTYVKYHKIREPIPEGWKPVLPTINSHHIRYSILIEKCT